MCMKNINATLNLFASVERADKCISFSVPFDTIKCIFKNNVPYISNFFIVANMNLLGTTNEEAKKINVVENRKELFCLIRLTKISSVSTEKFSWDIERFSVDASNKAYRFDDARVPTVNYRKIVEVQNIKLTENCRGDYALKLLVRTSKNEPWEVQSIARLTVI